MNEMRKLMEAIQQINEGWDPEAIAQAIYDDVQEGGSALELAAADSPEPYRAMVYEFGNLSGLYNAEALDGSEIWHRIIDKLEELFGEEPDDGQPTDYEEMQDFMGGDDWDHGQYDESIGEATEINEDWDPVQVAADELGQQIAGFVILTDHTNAHARGEERAEIAQIQDAVDDEIMEVVKSIRQSAYKYIDQRFRN